jgi:hypothetical protein
MDGLSYSIARNGEIFNGIFAKLEVWTRYKVAILENLRYNGIKPSGPADRGCDPPGALICAKHLFIKPCQQEEETS